MTQALQSVTHLVLNTALFEHDSKGFSMAAAGKQIQDASSVLSPLASSCPALQQLKINGDIGLEALSAFGNLCPSLVHLELTALSIPCSVMGDLHTLIPRLQHFEVCIDTGEQPPAGSVAYCCSVAQLLSSCAELKTLILPLLSISQSSVWSKLPSSLEVIRLLSCVCPPPPGMLLPVLTTFEARNAKGLDTVLEVQTIAGIIQAAPHVRLSRGYFRMFGDSDNLLGLTSLHDRLQPCPNSVAVVIDVMQFDIDASFMSLFPVFPSFVRLRVIGWLSSSNYEPLVRVFPNVVELTLFSSGFSDDCVTHLHRMPALHTLGIRGSNYLTDTGVLACMQLPCLRLLGLAACELISSEELLQAQAPVGLRVIVKVYII